MLINGQRALAYTARCGEISPIEGADRIELMKVLGWNVIVKKGEFTEGDLCVFFEIDSKLPETEWSEFMAAKHYKVKTMKLGKFGVISQGLALPISVFDVKIPAEAGADVTALLGVKYSVDEDNARKASGVSKRAKYDSMAARHKDLFKRRPFRWLMRRSWGRKLLFVFFGKKKDSPRAWPSHIAPKTDVERIQNCVWVLKNKKPYVATEKVDGSSCSIMAERKKFGKIKQYVCSRNVVFDTENASCFYDSNVYFEAYQKYNLKEKIVQIMKDYNFNNIAIQCEVYGNGIQKRDYSIPNHRIAVFHIVNNKKKLPMDTVVEICEKYDLPHVAIIDDNYILPDTLDELQSFVESTPSAIDGQMKEGIVFYDKETGQEYFKFVSPNYLMKYHS